MAYVLPIKKCSLKEKPYKNKKYLSWLHNEGLGCMVCGNTQIEVHHLDSGNRGRADNRCVVLCPEHHRGTFSPHGGNAKEFREEYTEQMEDEAITLFTAFESEIFL